MTSGPFDDDGLDAWLDELQVAAAIDLDAGTLRGRRFADYSLVARVAAAGPRTAEEAEELLADERLRELLRRAWAEEPPGAGLVERLTAEPYGPSLLALVPAPESDVHGSVAMGPSSWWEGGQTFEVPTSLAHAAASGPDLPLVFAARFADASVTLEGRGRAEEFAITAVADPGTATTGRYVAVQLVYPDSSTWMILPLEPEEGGASAAATMWCPQPRRVRVNPVADLDQELEDAVVRDRVEQSVAAADGRTQEVWRTVARRLPEGSRVRAAVVRGLGRPR